MFGNEAAAAGNVSILMKNLGGSTSPLIEYDDSIAYAEQYSKSLYGKSELFLVNWDVSSLVTTKNQKWRECYEQELFSMLSDDTLLASYIENPPADFSKAVDKAVYNICTDLKVEINKNFENGATIINKVLDVPLKTLMKKELRKNQAQLQILALIASNTDGKNLKDACQSCLNTFSTKTFNKLKSILTKRMIKIGIHEVKAKSLVRNQILQTSLSGLLTKTLKLMGECAKGFSYALIILDGKNLICLFTGTKTRTDNYMGIVSDEIIYQGTLNAFQTISKQYKQGKSEQAPVIEALFWCWES